jgi:hypothetical protein
MSAKAFTSRENVGLLVPSMADIDSQLRRRRPGAKRSFVNTCVFSANHRSNTGQTHSRPPCPWRGDATIPAPTFVVSPGS